MVRITERSGILNETTMTLHKQNLETDGFQTPCGHLFHVAQEQLRIVEIVHVTEEYSVSKCGQCFEDGGGY